MGKLVVTNGDVGSPGFTIQGVFQVAVPSTQAVPTRVSRAAAPPAVTAVAFIKRVADDIVSPINDEASKAINMRAMADPETPQVIMVEDPYAVVGVVLSK